MNAKKPTKRKTSQDPAAQRALHAQEATPKKPQPPEAPSISLPHPKVAML